MDKINLILMIISIFTLSSESSEFGTRLFENANVTININTNFHVNGTFTLFDLKQNKDDNQLKQMFREASKKRLHHQREVMNKEIQKDLDFGSGVNSDMKNNNLEYEYPFGEIRFDPRENNDSKRTGRFYENPSTDYNSINAGKLSESSKPITNRLFSFHDHESPMRTQKPISNDQVQGDYHTMMDNLDEINSRDIKSNNLYPGNSIRFKTCSFKANKKIIEEKGKIIKSYEERFGLRRFRPHLSRFNLEKETIKVLTELCMYNDWLLDDMFGFEVSKMIYGTLVSHSKQLDATPNEILDFLMDGMVNVTSRVAAEVFINATRWIKDNMEVEKSDQNPTIRLNRHVFRNRKPLSVDIIPEEEDDILNLDTNALTDLLRKKMQSSQKKMKSLKSPMAESFKAPSLISLKKNSTNSILSRHPTNDKVYIWMDLLSDKSKKLVVKEYITSKSPNLIGIQSYDPENPLSKIEMIITSLSKMAEYPACGKTLPYMKQMIDTCTVGFAILEASGKSLCSDQSFCPGKYLNSKMECVEKDDCATKEVVVNHRFAQYLNKTNISWKSNVTLIHTPTSSSQTICSINGVDLPETVTSCNSNKSIKSKSFNLIDFIILSNGSQIIGVPEGYVIVPHIGGDLINSFDCEPESECSGCLTGEKKCFGDELYCKRDGIMCTTDSECTCKVNPKSEVQILKRVNGNDQMIDSSMEIERINSIWAITEVISGYVEQSEQSLSSCDVSTNCNLGQISIMSPCQIKSIKIEISNKLIWRDIPIPWDLSMSLNRYTVHVYFKDHLEKPQKSTKYCQPFNVCDRSTCLFCKETIRQVRCWSVLIMIIPLIVAPLILVLIIWVLSFTLVKIGVLRRTVLRMIRIVWFLFCPCHLLIVLLMRCVSKGFKGGKSLGIKLSSYHANIIRGDDAEKLRNLIGSRNQDMNFNNTEQTDTHNNGNLRVPTRLYMARENQRQMPAALMRYNTPIYAVMILGLALSGLEACTDAKVTIIHTSNCLKLNGDLQCKLSSVVDLTITGSRQTVCFVVKDQSGLILKSIIINIHSLSLSCSQDNMFSTFDISAKTSHHANCFGRDYCYYGPASACKKFLNSESRQNEIFPNSVGKLRLAHCSSSPGCAANGCIACSEGCTFGMTSIENLNGVGYQVISCSSWNYQVNGDLKIKDHKLNSIHPLKVSDSLSKEISGITVSLKSITLPPSNFINKCFLKKENLFAMTNCQKGDGVTLGSIGEVRCPTLLETEHPGSRCSIATGIIEATRAGWAWVSQSRTVNISRIFRKTMLPRSYGGFIISDSNGDILSTPPANSMVTLQLKFKEMMIEAKVIEESCFASGANMIGCYSCSEGANLTIQISESAKIGEGSSILSHFECPESGINAIMTAKRGQTTLHSMVLINHANVNEVCNFTCGSFSQKITLMASLKESINLDPRINAGYEVSSKDSHSNEMDSLDIMNLFKSWKFKMAIMIILLGIISIIIFLWVIKMIMNAYIPSRKIGID